jgi:hypothetical protein
MTLSFSRRPRDNFTISGDRCNDKVILQLMAHGLDHRNGREAEILDDDS